MSTDAVLGLLVASLSVAATYAFCVRPMRRGAAHCSPAPADEATQLRAQIAELRVAAAGRDPS